MKQIFRSKKLYVVLTPLFVLVMGAIFASFASADSPNVINYNVSGQAINCNTIGTPNPPPLGACTPYPLGCSNWCFSDPVGATSVNFKVHCIINPAQNKCRAELDFLPSGVSASMTGYFDPNPADCSGIGCAYLWTSDYGLFCQVYNSVFDNAQPPDLQINCQGSYGSLSFGPFAYGTNAWRVVQPQ
jgi:hypothetical protein